MSDLDEFTEGSSFHRLLWDDAEKGLSDTELAADQKIRRVVLASGKVYFDLLAERDRRGIDDIYLLRIEQLYPAPVRALIKEFSRFTNAEFIWCQEEPKNQGAWSFIEPNIAWVLDHIGSECRRPRYVGRRASASPASGLLQKHQAQQKRLVDEALSFTEVK